MKDVQLTHSVANRRQVIAPRKFEAEIWYYVGKGQRLRSGTSIHVEGSTHAEAERKTRERLKGQGIRALNWIVGPKLRVIIDRTKASRVKPRRVVVQTSAPKLRVQTKLDPDPNLIEQREAKRKARKKARARGDQDQ